MICNIDSLTYSLTDALSNVDLFHKIRKYDQ